MAKNAAGYPHTPLSNGKTMDIRPTTQAKTPSSPRPHPNHVLVKNPEGLYFSAILAKLAPYKRKTHNTMLRRYYTAPAAEAVEVRVEENFVFTANSVSVNNDNNEIPDDEGEEDF